MTTIPELFERVAAKVPEIRDVCPKHSGTWWMLVKRPITDEYAHMLIEAACWRMLPNKSWEQVSTGDFVVKHDVSQDWHVVSDGKTLTEALLLAVEQVHGGKQ